MPKMKIQFKASKDRACYNVMDGDSCVKFVDKTTKEVSESIANDLIKTYPGNFSKKGGMFGKSETGKDGAADAENKTGSENK